MKAMTVLTLAGALIGAAAQADTITLKDGSKREGRIVREGKKQVVLEVAMGRLKAELILARKDIKSIEKGKTDNEKLLAEAKRRRPKLSSRDAKKWLAYAQWLDGRSGLGKDAKAAYERVIMLQPDNEVARRRLGYHRVGKKWLTYRQAAAEYRKLAAAEAKKKASSTPKLNVKVSSPAEDARKKTARQREIEKQLAQIVADYLGRKKSSERTYSGYPAGSNIVLTPRRGGYYEYSPYTGGVIHGGYFDHGYYYGGYYSPYYAGHYYSRYSYPYVVATGYSALGREAEIRFKKKGSRVNWIIGR